jgi:hypothetical protein
MNEEEHQFQILHLKGIITKKTYSKLLAVIVGGGAAKNDKFHLQTIQTH